MTIITIIYIYIYIYASFSDNKKYTSPPPPYVETTPYYADTTTAYVPPVTHKPKTTAYVPKTTAYVPPTYAPTTYATPPTYTDKPVYDKYATPSYGHSGRYSWGQWEGWLGCSVSCGTGLQQRRRQCNPYNSGYGAGNDKPAGGRYVRAATADYKPPAHPGKYPDKQHPAKLPAPLKPESYYVDPEVVPDPSVPYYSEDFQNVYDFPAGYDSNDEPSANSYGCDGEGVETRTCRLDPCGELP